MEEQCIMAHTKTKKYLRKKKYIRDKKKAKKVEETNYYNIHHLTFFVWFSAQLCAL